MELNVRRSGPLQTVLMTEVKPSKKTNIEQAAHPVKDEADWSSKAIAYLQRTQEEIMEEARKKQEIDNALTDMEQKKKQMDQLEKMLRTQRLCMKIAASIMRGDRVPPEDMKYLEEHDPDGFKLAMAMRKPKRNPEQCKSVLKDEDKRSESAESGENPGEAASGSEGTLSASGGAASGAASAGGEVA